MLLMIVAIYAWFKRRKMHFTVIVFHPAYYADSVCNCCSKRLKKWKWNKNICFHLWIVLLGHNNTLLFISFYALKIVGFFRIFPFKLDLHPSFLIFIKIFKNILQALLFWWTIIKTYGWYAWDIFVSFLSS